MKVRVIALKGFTDGKAGEHSYGHEFEQTKGAKLDGWIKTGLVKIDDRMAGPPPPKEEEPTK